MSIFYSSNSLGISDLNSALQIYQKSGISHIELSSTNRYIEKKELSDLLKSYARYFTYIIHNYFPAPKRPFILNLSSCDRDILRLSLRHCKRAIDLAIEIGAKLYSVHSGFRVDPAELGRPFPASDITPYDAAYENFIQSLVEICKYADKKGVNFAIENNVAADFNLINGKNELFLMCELWELERLFKDIRPYNLGLVIDLGHLNVNSRCLKFDKWEFLKRITKLTDIKAVHFHDNNGLIDQHLPLMDSSWIFQALQSDGLANALFVLEARIKDRQELIEQKKKMDLIFKD